MWVTKLLISPVKKKIFCPKTTKFGLKLASLFIAGSFGALLVGWLVVVARGLYIERHLFTLLLTVYLYRYIVLPDRAPPLQNLGKYFLLRLEANGECE